VNVPGSGEDSLSNRRRPKTKIRPLEANVSSRTSDTKTSTGRRDFTDHLLGVLQHY